MESTRKVAEFLANTAPEEIPGEALLLAKKAFIDCLGVSLAGSCTKPGVLMIRFVQEIGSQGGAGVIRSRFRCHPSLAALANGVSAHALDYDDFIPLLGHASAVLVPVGLALGEEMELSGKAILEAYVLGVEIGAKLASCLAPQHGDKGWHTTGTLGTIAAGAMAAKLLRLDVDQTCSALALAASQAAGMRLNFGSMAKPFHAGNAARSGVMAALLSQKGFSGNPEIFNGPFGFCAVYGGRPTDLEQSVGSLGAPFHLIQSGINFKRYSCCGGIHAGVDALLELRENQGIQFESVETIECWVKKSTINTMSYNLPSTPDEARFSIPFCLVTALKVGKLCLEEFTFEKLSDPEIRQMIKRVRVFPWTAEGEKKEKGAFRTKIRIRLNDGKLLETQKNEAKGSPALPFTMAETCAKFLDCSKGILPPEKARETVHMLETFETLPNIRKLMEILL